MQQLLECGQQKWSDSPLQKQVKKYLATLGCQHESKARQGYKSSHTKIRGTSWHLNTKQATYEEVSTILAKEEHRGVFGLCMELPQQFTQQTRQTTDLDCTLFSSHLIHTLATLREWSFAKLLLKKNNNNKETNKRIQQWHRIQLLTKYMYNYLARPNACSLEQYKSNMGSNLCWHVSTFPGNTTSTKLLQKYFDINFTHQKNEEKRSNATNKNSDIDYWTFFGIGAIGWGWVSHYQLPGKCNTMVWPERRGSAGISPADRVTCQLKQLR